LYSIIYFLFRLLNSLWGRFALRNRLSCTVYANNEDELAKWFNDKKIVLQQVEQITERTFMIVYQTKEEYTRESDCSNVILAIW
jgi:hypothetical protein